MLLVEDPKTLRFFVKYGKGSAGLNFSEDFEDRLSLNLYIKASVPYFLASTVRLHYGDQAVVLLMEIVGIVKEIRNT